jgi:hypothetical protein
LPGAITVAAPNGNESWTIGTSNNITWTYTGSPGNNVKIDLYKGGVFLVNLIASTPVGSSGSGSYAWAIDPAQGVVAGTDYQVHISSVDVPQISDSSNANFTLKAPPGTITVTAPATGASWARGILPHRITWTYTETTPGSLAGAMVNISLCEGTTCSLITTTSIGSGGSGSYSWIITLSTALASDYHIKVTTTTNFAVTGNSGVFTIKNGTL